MLPILTKKDCERPRTQAELRDWVDNLHRQFGETSAGKHAVRLRLGDFVKEFMEEIWPLALFADAFYRGRADVLFEPTIGDQRYDAKIVDTLSCQAMCHLEITQALYTIDLNPMCYPELTQGLDGHQSQQKHKINLGHQNHLRMRHLEEYGRAPNTGCILEQNGGSEHIQEVWPQAVEHKVLLAQTFAAIQAAVERKSRKNYDPHTLLIVEFDDSFIHSESDRRALNDFVRTTLVPTAANFGALYLVSVCERLAFKYDTRPAV